MPDPCPLCGQPQRPDAMHCSNCGYILQVACDHCGAANSLDATVCRSCGRPLRPAFTGIVALDTGKWARAFESVEWRTPHAAAELFKYMLAHGHIDSRQNSASDLLIAVPVTNKSGCPDLARVDGVTRIDAARGKPSASRQAAMMAAGPQAIETDFGMLVASRKNLGLLCANPDYWQTWPFADAARFSATAGWFEYADRFGSTIEIRIRSNLSGGRRLVGMLDLLFGKDPIIKVFDFADMHNRLERDGDLASLLNAFVAAGTAATRQG